MKCVREKFGKQYDGEREPSNRDRSTQALYCKLVASYFCFYFFFTNANTSCYDILQHCPIRTTDKSGLLQLKQGGVPGHPPSPHYFWWGKGSMECLEL